MEILRANMCGNKSPGEILNLLFIAVYILVCMEVCESEEVLWTIYSGIFCNMGWGVRFEKLLLQVFRDLTLCT